MFDELACKVGEQDGTDEQCQTAADDSGIINSVTGFANGKRRGYEGGKKRYKRNPNNGNCNAAASGTGRRLSGC